MEFTEIRPIISGVLGGLVATWLCVLWAKWVPKASNGKSADWLRQTYRRTIITANILLGLGMLGGLALYQFFGFANNDWRPLGLGFGGGSLAVLLALTILPLLSRGSPREAYAAYAISQKTPMTVLYGILMLGAALLCLALSTYLP